MAVGNYFYRFRGCVRSCVAASNQNKVNAIENNLNYPYVVLISYFFHWDSNNEQECNAQYAVLISYFISSGFEQRTRMRRPILC